jgi:glucose-6-phosphate-specific signal transduction histidine kinase
VWNTWGQYVAVAAAYEALYEITYHVSFPQFLLTTGLRLAFLLLLPTRFWPAIAIGESVPLLEHALFCADKFGWAWAVLASIPTVALWAPLLKALRDHWPLHDDDGRLRMPVILIAASSAALITAAITTLTLVAALRHAPGKWPDLSPVSFFFSYALGGYLGALTLTPTLLALYERFRGTRAEAFSMALLWRSPLLRDVMWWVVPALAAFVWVANTTGDDAVRQVARLALLWPVVGLASRHGWHGTAVGGMGASFALALTAQGLVDVMTLQVQLVLAVVLWGAPRQGGPQQPARTGIQPAHPLPER